MATLAQFVDPHPAVGNRFGAVVVPLSTGNVVVTSPGDDFAAQDAGAVYLFNGATGELISTLRGSAKADGVGDRIVPLENGNFVVVSPAWDNGSIVDAGAVTWASGVTGIQGIVSADNSLVGTSLADQVGYDGVTPLSNGHYVIASSYWNGGAGAATWGNGAEGIRGAVTHENSLVGSRYSDRVGGELTALPNGNYVVCTAAWSKGLEYGVGAVTWADGNTGVSGVVSASNSLTGTRGYDHVGGGGITVLDNGSYVINSRYWNGARGAVTWADGDAKILGEVNADNSLVGSTPGDYVGGDGLYKNGIYPLPSGNYVVVSYGWSNSEAKRAGAVTWGDGTHGVSGAISEVNSLVGTTEGDRIGHDGLRILANGNYVVLSGDWDNGAVADVGAVTWGDGSAGLVGRVSPANSLVGSTQQDNVGRYGAVLLTNGNYVLRNLNWDHGSIVNAGAVTWLDGQTPTAGEVSALNSLVGSASSDQVGYGGVTALTNGNYVVRSYLWDKGTVVDAGAVTWGNGSSGTTGIISSANSLVGDRWGDYVGYGYVLPLANGNYVASSPLWDNGAVTDAGAATWGNGNGGTVGSITSENSLVGSTDNDKVGNNRLIALPNGNYLVQSLNWDNAATVDAGAVTWGNGSTGIAGPVTADNSLVGSEAYDRISENGIFVLASGNFLLSTMTWNDGEQQNVGALTWGSSQGGLNGPINSTNSVVGRTSGDSVGYFGATELPNGNLVIASPGWDDGATKNAGAVTFGNGNTGVFGAVTPLNSVVGVASNTGLDPSLVLDHVNKTVIARFLTEGGGKVRVGSWDEGFNNAPLAADGFATTAEERSVLLDLRPLARDVETPQSQLAYQIVAATHGVVSATEETGVFRFTPARDFAGQAHVTYFVTDADGTPSEPAGSVEITVTPVNDAPKLNNALSPTLAAIYEGNRNSWGTPVWTLLPGFSDADAGAKKGLAVTAASGAWNGTWQYTLDGGQSWQALGAVSVSSAKLLPAHGNLSRVRFIPNAHFNGTIQLGFFAWDQTQGSAGGSFDLSGSGKLGGTTAFGWAFETASLTIKPINNAPLITIPSATVGYALNSPAVLIASTATVKDPDTVNFTGGALYVQITSGADASDRLLIGGPFKVVDGNLIWNNTTTIGKMQGGAADTPLLVYLNANATLYRVEQLVKSIKFGTVGGDKTGLRTVSVSLNDGSATGNTTNVTVQVS